MYFLCFALSDRERPKWTFAYAWPTRQFLKWDYICAPIWISTKFEIKVPPLICFGFYPVFLVCLWCLKYFCKIEGTNEIEEVCTAEMQIIDDCGSQHHAILDIITNTITIALAVTMFKICPREPTSFRKFSGAIVAAFKACNLGRSGCLGRLSSRPACPWGCTPTNRLYCRDMT